MKAFSTHRHRVLTCIAAAALTAAVIVPAASAVPPSSESQAELQTNVAKTKHEIAKTYASNMR